MADFGVKTIRITTDIAQENTVYGNRPLPVGNVTVRSTSGGSQDALSDVGGTNVYFGTIDVQGSDFSQIRLNIKIVTTTDESAKNTDVKWGFAPSDLGSNCTTQIGSSDNTGNLSLPNNDTIYYYTVEFARKDRYLHIWYDYDALGVGNTGTLDISVVKV